MCPHSGSLYCRSVLYPRSSFLYPRSGFGFFCGKFCGNSAEDMQKLAKHGLLRQERVRKFRVSCGNFAENVTHSRTTP